MLRTLFSSSDPQFTWVDVVDPSPADLQEVSERYGLYRMAVQDCLDPEHLPKVERTEKSTFLLLRAFDEGSLIDADTVQGFTRKVAVFFSDGTLVTIHRKDQPYLDRFKAEWSARLQRERHDSPAAEVVAALFNAVIDTYEVPLEQAESRLDGFEAMLFRQRDITQVIRDLFVIKRRITLAKRLLWRMLSLAPRLSAGTERSGILVQDLRENAESSHFYADELLDDVNNLLHMQLALAGHRTNEVVKVLTVFSAFFLPLTFLVGVYGMNFQYMPELQAHWGYPAAWAFMLVISLGIYVWFRRRRWL